MSLKASLAAWQAAEQRARASEQRLAESLQQDMAATSREIAEIHRLRGEAIAALKRLLSAAVATDKAAHAQRINHRAIVFAVSTGQGKFAVRTEDQRCAVFEKISGPELVAGDIVEGDVLARGVRTLRRGHEPIRVLGDSGPVGLDAAVELVKGARQRDRPPDGGAPGP